MHFMVVRAAIEDLSLFSGNYAEIVPVSVLQVRRLVRCEY
jgi:hypothetical protein